MESLSGLRVLAVDLDGTVLSKDYRISDRTVAAIKAARAAGLLFVVATGRAPETARKHLIRLGGADGFIAYNGAASFETDGEGLPQAQPIALSLVPEEPARKVVELSRRLGVHFHGFRGRDWLFETRYPETERYELRSGQPGLQVDFDAVKPLSFIKAMFLASDDVLSEARGAVLSYGLDAFGSGHGLLEVVAPGVDKARGLRAWLERRGLGMDSVLAFGDADNDEAMLSQAGLGVAMGNAPADMAERIGRKTGSVDEDGVADWLEREILATA